MSRLPTLTADDLDVDQRHVWDVITQGRRGPARNLMDAQGGLVGPFNALVHAPTIGAHVSAVGEALRFDSSLDRRLFELAVITVASHWRANFEWWVHSRIAIDLGVDPTVVEALRQGEKPSFTDESQETVYQVVKALLTTGRVDERNDAKTIDLLGQAGLIELVALVGYYCLIAFTVNTFDVELPEGNEPAWPNR